MKKSSKAATNYTCGLRKRTFWIICALTLAIAAAVIGGAAGAILMKEKSRHTSSPTIQPSSTSTPVSTTTLQPSSTLTFASPTPTAVTIDCPGSDNTTFTTSNGEHWLRKCNVDFGGPIPVNGNYKTYSIGECLEICATVTPKCYGVTWVYAQPQGVGDSYCWLHEERLEGDGVPRRVMMESAVLIDG
ncbi:uncharacterized protein BDZ99DRAFT_517183 [Mytilinidion resinicola]|uniref:Apple domain-containing protein n=1 Tax=Mytilinidion resinicola TaxID=574789 RepID=A0A6A6YXZ8_9PEZI|nr:uncharacterized protein BDZ99DRAFT_517183 [Mytilinidion resinicola]KAF2812874.1 hypothetical protein BDZ99DRAFT_517183 [Mytilinidion resinicola]